MSFQVDLMQVLGGAGVGWLTLLLLSYRKYGDYRARAYAAQEHFNRLERGQETIHEDLQQLIKEVRDHGERLVRLETLQRGKAS